MDGISRIWGKYKYALIVLALGILLMLLPGRDVGPREPALHAVRRVVNKSQVSGLALPKVPRKSDPGSKNWQAASAA